MTGEALALLRSIAADVRALRRAAERRQPQQPDAENATLLRAIYEIGDRAFTSKELAIHAELPAAVQLRAALLAAVGSTNARRIGKLLRKLQGHDIGGLTVTRVGEDRDGAIWSIAGLREFTPANPPCSLPAVALRADDRASTSGAPRWNDSAI